MEKLERLKVEARGELDKVTSEGHLGDLPVPLKDYEAYVATIGQILTYGGGDLNKVEPVTGTLIASHFACVSVQ